MTKVENNAHSGITVNYSHLTWTHKISVAQIDFTQIINLLPQITMRYDKFVKLPPHTLSYLLAIFRLIEAVFKLIAIGMHVCLSFQGSGQRTTIQAT